jgi:hypothetical protein
MHFNFLRIIFYCCNGSWCHMNLLTSYIRQSMPVGKQVRRNKNVMHTRVWGAGQNSTFQHIHWITAGTNYRVQLKKRWGMVCGLLLRGRNMTWQLKTSPSAFAFFSRQSKSCYQDVCFNNGTSKLWVLTDDSFFSLFYHPLSISLILLTALGSGVYSASNRNEDQREK